MRYIIHIGTNKTGTSTLQHYLGTYREELLKRGIWYPNIGQHRYAHHDFALAIKKDEFAEHDVDPEILHKAPSGVDTIILSSEAFHTVQSVEKIARWIPLDQATIVLYLREHVSYLASWYQQSAQQRTITCSFPEFAEMYGKTFTELIDRWRPFCGDRIKLRPYDRALLRDHDIVSDFFDTAFASPPPVKREFKDKNPSISGNLLFLKLVLNHMLTPEENESVVEELSALANLDERFGGKLPVSEREARRITRTFADDRKRLKKEFGIAFTPPRDGQAGHPVPDLATLQDDVQRILSASKDRGFSLYGILKEKRALLFPQER